MRIATILSALALGAHGTASADYTVTVNAKDTMVTWEGWGTSLCWWANVFGEREDVADVFFTLKDSVSIKDGPANLPALGFNIARYNIGGSGNNVIDNNGKKESMKHSENMPAHRFMETFWLDWFNSDPKSSSWNWNADPRQRKMVQLAKARGVNHLEAFSNSPPWWMTKNHATAGADLFGFLDNLQSWNYETFAVYLATVVKYAKDNWGFEFDYVEPFNEPMTGWWLFPGKQEGCHVIVTTQNTVIKHLRRHLNDRGLQSVQIAASDENSPGVAFTTLGMMALSSDVINAVNKVNTHGYMGLEPYRGPLRGALRDLSKSLGKRLWDSEYGEGDGSGLSLAESVGLDINEMGVSAFVYWQVLDIDGWGLIQSRLQDNFIGGANGKYFALAQYSRHIRPGMAIIRNSDSKTVVSYDAGRKVLVVVTVNMDANSQTISFDLSQYKNVAGPVKTWVTETSDGGKRYQTSTSGSLDGKTLRSSFPAKAVLTFEIEGVEL
ncbi:hypothetical protein Poli38472_000733 [Pythium oligandrum]|uniref:Endo-beta-1,6-galactanase-like domain-containing protein n=1 Tax=Pythium oligandrum TaxID=41045 RepID=A0A8K1FFL9_PYTOL|nr:hypothetical protein Poli38472_000733 [Pythium oligandrum]|eukprot:TMW60691.1 hypothetical protein Poli38472_000733 [Pythium oligandrum]